jgi:hypothetical protein
MARNSSIRSSALRIREVRPRRGGTNFLTTDFERRENALNAIKHGQITVVATRLWIIALNPGRHFRYARGDLLLSL